MLSLLQFLLYFSPHPPTHKHIHKITEGHIPEEPEVQRNWKQYQQGMLGWLGTGLRRGRKVPAYAMLLCSDPFWKCQKDTHLSLGGIATKTRIEFCST